MRTYKHWTPRYVYDRLCVMLYEKMNPDAPWLTRQMIEILDEWLKPTDIGLEWGSGRSTLWFAKRVAYLISIEDNPQWANQVSEWLTSQGLRHKTDCKLLTLSGMDFKESEYVSVVKDIAENSLDFCLVDGAERDICALSCISRIKPGGILIIDDIQRYLPRRIKSRSPNARGMTDGFDSEAWEKFGKIVSDWRCIWTSTGTSDTALWVKPL